MTSYLVFDTNALPVRGNFAGNFWTALFHLCSTSSIQPAASEVSIDEAVNLRRETASDVIDSLVSSHSKLSSLTDLAPTYFPTADEVALEYERELRSRFAVLPLDGDHAREAFRREARRIAPARNGAGGRDSAIWLTLVGLAKEGHEIHFITNNTKDFGKAGLHSDLQADLVGAPKSISYYFNPNEFLATIATKVSLPKVDNSALAAAFSDSLRGLLIAHLKENKAAVYTAERAFSADINIADEKIEQAYVAESGGLVRVAASAHFSDAPGEAWCTAKFTGWLGFEPTTDTLTPSEADHFDVNLSDTTEF